MARFDWPADGASMILLCVLALLGPERPFHLIGTTTTRYDIYRTDRTEHCFEEITLIGRTRWQDELVSMQEVDMELCR